MSVAVAVYGSATGAVPRSFEARSDAARTEACLATYMTLGKAAVALTPKTEADAFEFEVGRGMKRLHPFTEKAVRAVGESQFYHDAVMSRAADDRILMLPIANDMRRSLARRLALDADHCDQLLDTWGAPMMCFSGDVWHVC